MKQREGGWRYWICWGFFLVFLCGNEWGWAQAPDSAETVRKYCEGDAQGARLVSSGHQAFWALMDPMEEGVAPGWDAVALIADFTVGTPHMRGRTAEVPVTFQQLGFFSDRFEAHPASITVNVQLINRADGWKIRRSDMPPHVYVRTLQDHFLQMRWWMNTLEERDRVRKVLYQVFRAILFEQSMARISR